MRQKIMKMNNWQIEGTVHEVGGLNKVSDKLTTLSVVISWESVGTDGSSYWHKTAVEFMNAKALDAASKLHAGDTLGVYFRPESREWNGRWFTTARATGIYKHEPKQRQPVTQPSQHAIQPTPVVIQPASNDEDLPF